MANVYVKKPVTFSREIVNYTATDMVQVTNLTTGLVVGLMTEDQFTAEYEDAPAARS